MELNKKENDAAQKTKRVLRQQPFVEEIEPEVGRSFVEMVNLKRQDWFGIFVFT